MYMEHKIRIVIMDMMLLTVIVLAVVICVGCSIAANKVVNYRDSHLEEWTA